MGVKNEGGETTIQDPEKAKKEIHKQED